MVDNPFDSPPVNVITGASASDTDVPVEAPVVSPKAESMSEDTSYHLAVEEAAITEQPVEVEKEDREMTYLEILNKCGGLESNIPTNSSYWKKRP